MAAEIISDPAPLQYHEHPWGDLIYGTKAELQALGLGVGVPFPGEPNGPKRLLNVVDPRGFPTKIECCKSWRDTEYAASISFTGRDRPQSKSSAFAPGVTKEECFWSDDYIGTEAALVGTGLVQAHQLPGKPGMRKTRVTIFADGSMPTGASTAPVAQARQAGAKSISRVAGKKYRVCVMIERAAGETRRDVGSREYAEWEQRVLALPRPARLRVGGGVVPSRGLVGTTAKVILFPRARTTTTRFPGKAMQRESFGDDLGAALDDILDIDDRRHAYIACLALIQRAMTSQGT